MTARGDVLVAWVHSEWVAYSWFASIFGVVMSSDRVGPYVAMKYGTDGLVAARNKVAAQFVESGAEWLWWVDTDMGFTPDTLDRLLAAADPVERPLVGALCFANRETEPDGMGWYRTRPSPTLFQWVRRADGKEGFTPILDYPRDALVEVAGTGSACLVIHRSVFEAVREKFGPTWYVRQVNPSTGELVGEDLSFCARVAACGLPMFVDTSVKTSHLKSNAVQESDYEHPGG